MRTPMLQKILIGLGVLLVAAGAQAQGGYYAWRSPAMVMQDTMGPVFVPSGARGWGIYSPYAVAGATGANLYGGNAYNVPYSYYDIPRTSEQIVARQQSDGQLWIGWQGDPSLVTAITFALLDQAGAPVQAHTVLDLPAEAHFDPGKRAVAYAVHVEYVNGTTTTVVSPLPPKKKAPAGKNATPQPPGLLPEELFPPDMDELLQPAGP